MALDGVAVKGDIRLQVPTLTRIFRGPGALPGRDVVALAER